MGPVLPPRSTICGPPSHHHYSAPLNFRKGLVSKCTWKCTAIIVIMLSVVLMSTLIYITGKFSNTNFGLKQKTERLCSRMYIFCHFLEKYKYKSEKAN